MICSDWLPLTRKGSLSYLDFNQKNKKNTLKQETMEIVKVYEKISGRAYTKYNGHNLRRLEIEVLDAIESQGMD